MSDAAADHPLSPEQIRTGQEAARIARESAGFALGIGLTGLQSLMRPDDVPPGRARQAYRLAFGGLTAVSGLLVASDQSEDPLEGDLDPTTERRLELAYAIALGTVSAALFHPTVTANWWGDRLLSRLGIRHPRTAGALIAVSVSAGVIVFIDRMGHVANHHIATIDEPAEQGDEDGEDDEVTEAGGPTG